MDDKQTISTMQQAVDEITALRGQLSLLRPKAEAFDAITTILGMMPQPSQGYGVDIVWQLRRAIDDMTPKPEAVPAETEAA